MIIFKHLRNDYNYIAPDFMSMIKDHWKELGEQGGPLDFDIDFYAYNQSRARGLHRFVGAVDTETQKYVGYFSLCKFKSVHHRGQWEAHIDVMYIAPEYRGLKLGRELLEEIEAHATEMDCSTIRIGSNVTRPIGKFLERFGYTETETIYSKVTGE